jgi:hypothetical protein
MSRVTMTGTSIEGLSDLSTENVSRALSLDPEIDDFPRNWGAVKCRN